MTRLSRDEVADLHLGTLSNNTAHSIQCRKDLLAHEDNIRAVIKAGRISPSPVHPVHHLFTGSSPRFPFTILEFTQFTLFLHILGSKLRLCIPPLLCSCSYILLGPKSR